MSGRRISKARVKICFGDAGFCVTHLARYRSVSISPNGSHKILLAKQTFWSGDNPPDQNVKIVLRLLVPKMGPRFSVQEVLIPLGQLAVNYGSKRAINNNVGI